jgi:hypothetical protein
MLKNICTEGLAHVPKIGIAAGGKRPMFGGTTPYFIDFIGNIDHCKVMQETI